MQGSKAIILLKTFSKEEFKSYGLFVRSPYFNKENIQINLYCLLRKYYPDFNSPELEKEKIYSALYPGRRYNDGAMRNIISDSLKLGERFLAIQKFQSDNYKSDYYLLEELRVRKLRNHFLNRKNKAENEIEKRILKDELYYDRKIDILRLYARFLRETETTFIQRNKVLQETSDLLAVSCLMKLLYYNTYMLTVQTNVTDVKYRLNFADEIDSFLEKQGKHFYELPYIKGYRLSFKLVQTEEEKYFYSLRDFLGVNIQVIQKSEIKDIYTVLENYCYKKVTQGEVAFIKEQFNLYKQSVESGNYTNMGFIPSTFFMSIVVIGFKAGEFEWTKNFIKNYINEVREDLRENTFNFCEALKYYWEKKYEDSLNRLSKVTTEEFGFKQNIKSLTLQIYYEINETEPFYSHIDAYKHFILNNKLVHERVREQVNNYINFSKKLFDIKNLPVKDEAGLVMLKKEISDSHSLINKIWLLDKADEIHLD
jgi:hypothetical protein